MVHLRASALVLVAGLARFIRAQQVDYYFLVPPDANNIEKPFLQFVAGETFEAQWHNPGDPINLYLTWCDGQNNRTLLDSVPNTGQASVTLDRSYLSDCSDYMLTVLGVQNGAMDWGQPTGSLPFNIVDVDDTPNMAASLATLMVTDTDPAGFAAATAFITLAVSVSPTPTTSPSSSSSTTPSTTPSPTTSGGTGGGGGGGHSGGGSGSKTSNNGSPATTLSTAASGGGGGTVTSGDGSPSTTLSTAGTGTDSNHGTTGTAAPSSDTGLSPQAKVGVGVGVGLGLPLLAAIAALAWIMGRRSQPASHPPDPSPYGIETTQTATT